MGVDRNGQELTNRDRLALLAEAIYGPLWQNAAARALGVNTRQVHRWVSGQYQPRDEVIRRMIRIALQKRAEIDKAIKDAESGPLDGGETTAIYAAARPPADSNPGVSVEGVTAPPCKEAGLARQSGKATNDR